MSRYFLFGFWEVPEWGYTWGHTAAQIQLIYADFPITVYKARNDKPKPGEQGFSKTAEEAARDYARWKKRKEEEKKKGIKVDLDTFLSTGEKKEI